MDCCALNRDNSAVKATAKFSGLHNETTAQSFLYELPGDSDETTEKGKFLNELLRFKSRQQRSQGYSNKLRTLQQDHITELFYVNCWRIGRDHREIQISIWIALLKIEITAQSRLQQNSPDFTTRPQHRDFLYQLHGESDKTTEKGIF